MTIKTIAATTAIVAAGASTAFAGGLDRATFSSNILYEKGTYVEVVYGLTTPSVSSSALPVGNVAKSFNTVKLGFKTDLTDKIAVAMTYTNQPVGADIDYGALGVSGVINAQRINLLGKYQFSERVSAYGGVKYQYINGTINVGPVSIVAHGESEFGYIAGAAYEIPDIKLRVALSFETQMDYSLTSTVNIAPTGISTAGTPEAWTLEFQSGVAPKTLVFGRIRYAQWKDVQITVPVLGTITSNENTTAYTLGVAHKLSDAIVGFVSIGYEASDDVPQGTFSPTDGQTDFTIGGQYDVGKGYKISGSLTYSKRGDAVLNATSPFAGSVFASNKVLTYGLKLSKSF